MHRIAALLAFVLLTIGAGRAEAQSREQVDRLVALAQVWGFLKYFHPGVAAGTIDWDSTLVAAVPKVTGARTNAEFNTTIEALLDAAGSGSRGVNSAQGAGQRNAPLAQ